MTDCSSSRPDSPSAAPRSTATGSAPSSNVTIIAEAGLNHGGSLVKALKLVDAAKAAGADIVKFQTFNPALILHRADPDYASLAALAFGFDTFRVIAQYCEHVGIEFLSTPGDEESLQFLVEELGVHRIKIGSDDLTYQPLVDAAFKTGLPVILSTGMANLSEIRMALPGPLLGLEDDKPYPPITLLHCVSAYPCPADQVNLKAISALKHFGYPVGYSHHGPHGLACLAAVALGASVIEAHLMLDADCVDAAVSLDPTAFAMMVMAIRRIEPMLGHGRKEPMPAEVANIEKFRKGADGKRSLAA